MIQKEQEEFKMAQLISDAITGVICEEDRQRLEAWLAESDEHRVLFEKMSRKGWYRSEQERRRIYSSEKGWKALSGRLEKPSRGKKISLVLFKYAAVAAVVISSVFLVREFFTESPEPMNANIAYTAIEPGVKGAKLILDNGRQIPLSSDSVFVLEEEGTRIDKTRETLDYTKSREKPRKEKFHTIVTSKGEEFTLHLSDGSRVILNAESEIRYPVTFIRNERMVEVSGEAYFDVVHEENRPFIVVTKSSETRVLGTSFNVRAYQNDPGEQVTLVEGAVRIARKSGSHSPVTIKPGEQATIMGEEGAIPVKKVNTGYYTAWIEGRFIFQDKRLEEIMTELNRWYHFSVEYRDESLKDIRFGATLDRYDEVNPIFHLFNTTQLVRIEQNGTHITIHPPDNKANS